MLPAGTSAQAAIATIINAVVIVIRKKVFMAGFTSFIGFRMLWVHRVSPDERLRRGNLRECVRTTCDTELILPIGKKLPRQASSHGNLQVRKGGLPPLKLFEHSTISVG